MFAAKSKVVQQRAKLGTAVNEQETKESIPKGDSKENGTDTQAKDQRMPTKVRKFPRPGVKTKHYREVKRHKFETYNSAPIIGTNSVCENVKLASARFINPSTYAVINHPKQMAESKVPISLMVQPLNLVTPQDDPIPQVIRKTNNFLRCSNCFAFRNPFMNRLSPGSLMCNICNQAFATAGYNISPDDIEANKGVYDLYVPPTGNPFSVPPLVKRRFIFCIEMSYHTVMNYTVELLADYIPYVLEGIPFKFDIGFVFYDTFVHYIKFSGGSSLEDIVVTRVQDSSVSFAPLPSSDFLFDYSQEPDKTSSVFQFLKQRANTLREKFGLAECAKPFKPLADVRLSDALLQLAEIFGPQGAKVLVFNHTVENTGKYAIIPEAESAPQAAPILGRPKEEDKSNLVCQNKSYMELGVILKNKNICVDLFCIGNSKAELPTVSLLSMSTGGEILTRRQWLKRRAYDFYYALLKCLGRPSGSNVQMRVRANGQLNIKKVSGKFGTTDSAIISLPWVSADDYFIFHFTLASQVQKKDHLYAQVVIIYDDAWGSRFIRIINTRFVLVDSAHEMYTSLNMNGLFFDLLRSALDQLRSKSTENLRKALIAQFKDIISHFRLTEFCENSLKELSVPKKIEGMLMLIHSALREDIFSPRKSQDKDALFCTYLRMLGNPVEILTYLYPKIYALHLLDERIGNSAGSQLENGTTIMPDNVPCTIEALSVDGIYLIDEGALVHLVVFEGANSADISKIFGVESAADVAQLQELPALDDSSLNLKVRNIIDECRRLKHDQDQQVKFWAIGYDSLTPREDNENLLLDRVLKEDAIRSYNVSALSFFKQLNKLLIMNADSK